MKRPLIGITPLYDYNLKSWWIVPGYMEGVEKAGGLALMLPFTDDRDVVKDFAQRLDGILLTGGPDVNPALYGKEISPHLRLLAPIRDTTEKLYFEEMLARDKAVLGICRGIQFINAMFGGTMYQDLPTAFETPVLHDQDEKGIVATHAVDILPGTPLADWMEGKTRLSVNSFHHQAVKETGKGLAVMAKSSADGLTEAVYSPAHRFCCGVQWHPELLRGCRTPEIADQADAVFRALVRAAGKNM